MSRSTLDRALCAMNPTADETLLMRALIRTDAQGANAWQQFTQQHGDLSELFRTDKGELRRLSPLLARTLKTNGAEVEAHMWTVLRMASMREGLRAKIYQEVLGEVIGLLGASEVEFAVIRGAAIGALAYGDVSARHSHDIDILVNAADVQRCVSLLLGAGYTRDFARELEAGQTLVPGVVHGTSLPVRFHSSLFELDCYSANTHELLSTRRNASLEGVNAPVLSAEITLLQLLAHASYSTTRHTFAMGAGRVSCGSTRYGLGRVPDVGARNQTCVGAERAGRVPGTRDRAVDARRRAGSIAGDFSCRAGCRA